MTLVQSAAVSSPWRYTQQWLQVGWRLGHGYQGLYTWYVVVPQDDPAAALAPGPHRCRVSIPLKIRRHDGRQRDGERHDRVFELEGSLEITAEEPP